ncbi:MAG: winged helix-turn-helix domain-containing protein [Blastocatellia bacterium]|nr:winged helix-turn-helix domain-containing protein [Blastocatellia bacterium]
MRQLSWTDAAEVVLRQARKPMTCVALADEILSRGLRDKSGVTPSSSLNAALRWSIAHQSPARFIQTGAGVYALAPRAKG